jgi:hypothetical protein
MGIINRMRKQTAVYWALSGTDGFDQPTFEQAVEIDVRWEDKQIEFNDIQGKRIVSRSVVAVPSVTPVGGYLLLGTLQDVPDDALTFPVGVDGAFIIQGVNATPDLGAKETLHEAML